MSSVLELIEVCTKHHMYKSRSGICPACRPDPTLPATGINSVAIKNDDSKVRLELLSPIAMTEIARVLTFGAKKYSEHNWRNGFKWSRLLGAAMRHLLAFIGGENKDPETGLSHLAHAGCCIMFLLEHETTHKDLDDRYKV